VDPVEVDVRPDHHTFVDTMSTIYDVGNAEVIGGLLAHILNGNETRIRGVSKVRINLWFFTFRLPVMVDRVISNEGGSLGSAPVDAQLMSLAIEQDHENGDVLVRGTAKLYVSAPPSVNIDMTMPRSNWTIGIRGCNGSTQTDTVTVTSAIVEAYSLELNQIITVTATAVVRHLPAALTERCSATAPSPLDTALQRYLSGKLVAMQIQGAQVQPEDTPSIMRKLIAGVTALIDIPMHDGESRLLESLELREFAVQYGSPLLASAEVRAHVRIPSVVHIDEDVVVQVMAARGVADLYYDDKYFARAFVEDWAPCVTQVDPERDGIYIVDFSLDEAPVEIVDQGVLRQIITKLLVSPCVPIQVAALVDAIISTPVGEMTVTHVPVAGDTEFCRNRLLSHI
jgi:hypothetical protein